METRKKEKREREEGNTMGKGRKEYDKWKEEKRKERKGGIERIGKEGREERM
jgi:hypothetical protein